jgi:hypothetical protein
MRPPIFEACVADTTVQSLLGGVELRVYQFGDAPQDCKVPYVVWQIVYGQPLNALNELPTMDSFGTQIDVYGKENDPGATRAVAKAMRNALEPFGYITEWRGESRDPDTRNYRVSFTVDWFVERT